jgi:hypothetical protein
MKPTLLYPMSVIYQLMCQAKAHGLEPQLTLDKDLDWHLIITRQVTPERRPECGVSFGTRMVRVAYRTWEPHHFKGDQTVALPSTVFVIHGRDGKDVNAEDLWSSAREYLQLSETVS